MDQKLKSFVWSEQTYLALLLCLVGMLSFVLGRYSVNETTQQQNSKQNQAGIVFVDTPTVLDTLGENRVGELETAPITVIASQNGTKYHLPSCSGAKSIKEENKIYFNSIEEAKSAGYTPAGNCPALQ